MLSKDYARRCGRCHPTGLWKLPWDEEIRHVVFRFSEAPLSSFIRILFNQRDSPDASSE